VESHGVPGAALAVVRHGELLHQETRGLARLPDGPTITPRTSFRLASITKQFTAKATALVIDDGHLILHTPVRKVLPTLPGWTDPIRVGHLLAHTAGLPTLETLLERAAPGTAPGPARARDRDVVHLLAGTATGTFEPGSRYAYSDTGYILLAVLLEEVAGQAFGDVLSHRIFRPLGMVDSVAHVEGETTVPHRAWGYRLEGDGFVDADQGPTTATLGDGGVYASLRDLVRWDAALRRPGFQADPETLAPFAPPPPHRAGADADAYGYGWFLDTFRGRRRQRHEGWTTGFQNEIQRFPGTGLTVIMLTNRSSPAPRATVEAVAEAYDDTRHPRVGARRGSG
jgi:CubicO group peptidase (beta-lactamase class C family)